MYGGLTRNYTENKHHKTEGEWGSIEEIPQSTRCRRVTSTGNGGHGIKWVNVVTGRQGVWNA
eukprot:3583413-Amphidinium_carterae.1